MRLCTHLYLSPCTCQLLLAFKISIESSKVALLNRGHAPSTCMSSHFCYFMRKIRRTASTKVVENLFVWPPLPCNSVNPSKHGGLWFEIKTYYKVWIRNFIVCWHIITLFISITMLCGSDNFSKNILHIHIECGENSMEYCQSQRTLLWIWIMLWQEKVLGT